MIRSPSPVAPSPVAPSPITTSPLPARHPARAPSLWACALAGLVWVLAPLPGLAQHDHHGEHGATGDHAAHQAMLEAPAKGSTAIEATVPPAIPDTPVLDQAGEPRDFYSDLVEGRRVAVNFIFTTCTTICPPMGAHFGKLQDQLGERLGSEVHLISVSVDPTVDTPERLAAWADKFGRREGWTLVTGDKLQVDTLLKALGAFTPDKTDHAPLVLVGDDATGTWRRVWGLAPPATLVRALDAVAGGGGEASR